MNEIQEALHTKFDQGSGLRAGGVFKIEHIRDGEIIHTEVTPNIVLNSGLNYLLDAALSSGPQITNFYVSLYRNNYTAGAATTFANFLTAASEISTQFSTTARLLWGDNPVSNQNISNGTPIGFSATEDTSVWGAFIVGNDNVLGSSTGTLIAATKFNAVRSLLNGDILNITYSFTIADA
jgi:hypothetical protein